MSIQASPMDRRLDALVAELEASGDFRVLRRLVPTTGNAKDDPSPSRRGLFVDVETTGLDPDSDQIIELAMVPFRYALDGRILEKGTPFEALRDPGRPLPEAITRLTGITDDMLAGRSIDGAVVSRMVADADLIVAHNAAFDRRFLERFDAGFARKPWACSMTGIDWKAEGFEGTKLVYLAMGAGFFYDRHRATNDCHAALELLSRPLPVSDRPAMACLLESARCNQLRIRAMAAPFGKKEALKKRGYRWSDGGGARAKAWYIDVEPARRDEELTYLAREVYLGEGHVACDEISAFERFSDRV